MTRFLGPLQQAASCLGACKVTTSPGARNPKLGEVHAWSLNSGAGVTLRTASGGVYQFDAGMRWKLIEDDRDGYGPLRVSTVGYMYSLSDPEQGEFWAHHWHPDGVSPVAEPHLHLGPELLAQSSPVSSKAHLPVTRTTFENAVRWVFEFGVPPAHPNWRDRLDLAETPHLLYRSWTARQESR